MIWKKKKRRIRISPLDEREIERFGYRLKAGAGILDAMIGIRILEQSSNFLSKGYGVVESMKLGNLSFTQSEWELMSIGEDTGTLGDELLKILKIRQRNRETKREFYGQLLYPVVVLFVSISVMLILSFFVIPEIKSLFQEMLGEGNLPFLTENIGTIYASIALLVIVISAIVSLSIFCLSKWAKSNRKVAKTYAGMMSFLPQIGAHFNETKQMRFCEQLGLMLRAGVSMTDALERITKGDWSEWDRFRINTIRKGLIDGERLSQLIAECVFLEKESVKLLEIGEETGQTCARLEGISREMSIRIRWRIQQGIRLMEPCLVIVLAFLVGGMLAAFLIPLIDLYKYSL